jgi:hypothetical protein
MDNKVEIFTGDVASRLEELAKQTKDVKETSQFFGTVYPELEEFFYEIRAKGILGGYIKE